jgi:hypothetical protein
MIFEWLLESCSWLLNAVLSLLDILPDMPQLVQETLDGLFGFMYDGVAVASIFIDFRMVRILIPLVITIANLDKVIKFIVFVIKKIPFIGVK